MTGWRLLLLAILALIAALAGGCAALGQQAIRITGPGGWGVSYEWGGRSNDAVERAQTNAAPVTGPGQH